METRAHYVAVGAFVLTMVFLAFVAVLWLAGKQFTSSFAHYDIYFEGPVSGLNVGARAEYNGIPVGTVSDIEIITNPEILAENGGKPIRVTIEIKSTVPVHKDSAATIQSNILSGVSYILISPGRSQELIEAKRGERYPVIRSRRATLASLAARGPQLLDKLDVIFDHVDDVLSDENRARFADTLENIRQISHDLAQHSDEIASNAGSALKAAAGLFTNLDSSFSKQGGPADQLSAALEKAGVALADFDKLAKDLDDTNRQLSGAVQDLRPGVRNFSQHTLGNVDALVSEMRQFISGLSRLTSQLERDPQRSAVWRPPRRIPAEMTRHLRLWWGAAAAIALLAVGGCAKMFTQEPRPLYRLSAPAPANMNLPHTNAQIIVVAPYAPEGLDLRRIAVVRASNGLDYLADGDWADRTPAMVRARFWSRRSRTTRRRRRGRSRHSRSARRFCHRGRSASLRGGIRFAGWHGRGGADGVRGAGGEAGQDTRAQDPRADPHHRPRTRGGQRDSADRRRLQPGDG